MLEVNEIVEALANVKGALAETDSVGAAIFGDIDAMSINNLLAAFDLDERGPLESASVDYEGSSTWWPGGGSEDVHAAEGGVVGVPDVSCYSRL